MQAEGGFGGGVHICLHVHGEKYIFCNASEYPAMSNKDISAEQTDTPEGQAAAGARETYWDVVKGLLIILMVLGHAMQYAGGGNFWGNPLWMGIYLFHMPLFALVSGCFVFQSIHRHRGMFIGHIARHLLIPGIFTALVCLAIKTLLTYCSGETPDVPPYTFLYTAWFLIFIFECGVFTWIMARSESLWWRAAWFVIPMAMALLWPDFPLAGQFTFLYPIFLLGAWVRHQGLPLGNIWLGMGAAVAYVVVYCVFQEDWYVYRTPLDSLEDTAHTVPIYLARLLGGIAGCFLLLFAVKRLSFLQESRILPLLGGSTLAIYLLQIYFWDFIWKPYCPNIDIWLCFPLTAGVLALCYGIYRACRRVPVLGLLMFGEQYRKR